MPLSEGRQLFTAMDSDLRRQLPEQLEMHAPRFQLTDLVYDSFCLRVGFCEPGMRAHMLCRSLLTRLQ